MQEINASIGFDRKLWRQDIRGSLAHAAMLAKIGVLERRGRTARSAAAWRRSRTRSRAGTFPFDTALEDIHMNIEARLTERIGEAGRRLHTARSRNDQVATDFRLWVRDAIDGLDAQLADLMLALAERAGGARGRPDARLHPSADRPAGDVRPPSAGLCRDAGPRSRPAGGLPARG